MIRAPGVLVGCPEQQPSKWLDVKGRPDFNFACVQNLVGALELGYGPVRSVEIKVKLSRQPPGEIIAGWEAGGILRIREGASRLPIGADSALIVSNRSSSRDRFGAVVHVIQTIIGLEVQIFDEVVDQSQVEHRRADIPFEAVAAHSGIGNFAVDRERQKGVILKPPTVRSCSQKL